MIDPSFTREGCKGDLRMARRFKLKYALHRPRGQARVRINGKAHWLGSYDSQTADAASSCSQIANRSNSGEHGANDADRPALHGACE